MRIVNPFMLFALFVSMFLVSQANADDTKDITDSVKKSVVRSQLVLGGEKSNRYITLDTDMSVTKATQTGNKVVITITVSKANQTVQFTNVDGLLTGSYEPAKGKEHSVKTKEKDHFKANEGFSLTYLPFISRAVIDAIAAWPNINSSVGDDELIVHNFINLGIAVDLNFEGLLVPVIHDADGKRLRLLAREISGLAGKARSKRLTMDDISGGTFTITNAGPFGTLITIPVINQPQVAILATDGVRKKPVVVELPNGDDAIVIHPIGNLVLSFDHRAVDGAYAAAFMAEVKEILETRDWSAEL